ncbi:protein phosphatase 2C domain-containing protein [Streptomyces sp. NPDC005529]|uniref:protein phosphatase 2C domain-containing protein n=1 Tax=unclassified Streptomyces TaxID=2593676 RepID=UPI00367380F4
MNAEEPAGRVPGARIPADAPPPPADAPPRPLSAPPKPASAPGAANVAEPGGPTVGPDFAGPAPVGPASPPRTAPAPPGETPAGPAPAGPAPARSAPTAPPPAGPAPVGPGPAGSAPTGPPPADPAPAGPVPHGPGPAGPPAAPPSAGFGPAGPAPVGPAPARSAPAGPAPAGPAPAGPAPAGPAPVGPGPARSAPTGPPPAGPAPAGPVPHGPGPAGPAAAPPSAGFGPAGPAPVGPAPAGPAPASPALTGPPPAGPAPAGPPPAGPAPVGRGPAEGPGRPVPSGPNPVGAAPAGPAEGGHEAAAPTGLPSTTGGFRTPRVAVEPEDARPAASGESALSVPRQPTAVGHVGSGPPTYDAEPTALPPTDPDELDDLVADTVLDGARYGTSTLRAASVRGDSARYRGEPRRDALLTARFGSGEQALVLVAMATGARATPGAHRAAAEACRWIARAVGRSHARLSDDIRAARRGDLKSGLHRLTDRSLGKLRASAAEQGVEPEEYTAGLRCLLLPADPECRTRVFFGVGAGGLFRLRDGEWQDIEPRVAEATGDAVVGFGSPPHETPGGDRLTMDLGITTPPSPYEPAPRPPRPPFRFRASIARPGDTLLLCTGGMAEPLRGEPELAEYLTTRWSQGEPPGLAAFLADSQVRVKGYADDRTAAAVWEA